MFDAEKERDNLFNAPYERKSAFEKDIAKKDMLQNGLTKDNFGLFKDYGFGLKGEDRARFDRIMDDLL